MALFLPIVLEKELKNLDDPKVRVAFETLKNNFTVEMQSLILCSIEIALQGEFIELLFDDVLGYTRFPRFPWHIKREQNSETSNERADAAIAKNSDEAQVIGVVELKGTDTHDLKSVEKQVFKYFRQHPNCRYAITSNYQSIRLYIDDNQGYEEFNIFDLVNNNDYERFRLLYCYLHKDAVLGEKTQKLRAETIIREKEVTEKLYQLYKDFRVLLYNGLKLSNRQLNAFTIFQKTQKLMDRFLFILFAEDKDLLPRFTIKNHINAWITDGRKGTLLQVMQGLFRDLNQGNTTKKIFAYNGGLFAPDPILDGLVLPVGNVLEIYLLKLEAYDFKTEVDVAILGHIFEQSLNDLDEMKSLAAGETLDKSKTKRKKDGVFYTPQYITRYIIENTIGALCTEKRHELGIFEGKKTTVAALTAYREWLLQVTLLDPACGSGAFLNEALQFFIGEHQAVDERMAGAQSIPTVYQDYTLQILENNLYGVDLNEESVEIAQLSLWLATAQVGRKLVNLNNNIKVGNSLIDDKKIDKKAFKWQREFSHIFKKGGFDVVVGNPPYVNARNMKENDRIYLTQTYKELTGAWDLYVPFLLKGKTLSKTGIYGWIIPNKLLSSDYAIKTLNHLKETGLNQIIDISHLPIFEGVGVYPIILLSNKNTNFTQYKIDKIEDLENLALSAVKINTLNRFKKIKDFGVLMNAGTTGFEATKIIPLINEKKQGIPFAVSGSIDPYWIDTSSVPYMKSKYTNPYIRLDKSILADSKIAFWNKPKIIIAGMTKRIEAYYTTEPLALGVGVYGIYDFAGFDPLFLLAILNSKFLTFYLNIEFKDKHLAGGYLAINKSTIEELPLVKATPQQQLPFIALANKMLTTNEKIETLRTGYVTHLQAIFSTKIVLNKKINDWHGDTWQALVAELRKQKLTLLPKQETVTKAEFEKVQALIKGYQVTLKRTDVEIDEKVYELYDLTPEEIEMVERG